MNWRKQAMPVRTEEIYRDEKGESSIIQILDSEIVDSLMEKANLYLWKGIVFFCIPYFLYLIIRVFA